MSCDDHVVDIEQTMAARGRQKYYSTHNLITRVSFAMYVSGHNGNQWQYNQVSSWAFPDSYIANKKVEANARAMVVDGKTKTLITPTQR